MGFIKNLKESSNILFDVNKSDFLIENSEKSKEYMEGLSMGRFSTKNLEDYTDVFSALYKGASEDGKTNLVNLMCHTVVNPAYGTAQLNYLLEDKSFDSNPKLLAAIGQSRNASAATLSELAESNVPEAQRAVILNPNAPDILKERVNQNVYNNILANAVVIRSSEAESDAYYKEVMAKASVAIGESKAEYYKEYILNEVLSTMGDTIYAKNIGFAGAEEGYGNYIKTLSEDKPYDKWTYGYSSTSYRDIYNNINTEPEVLYGIVDKYTEKFNNIEKLKTWEKKVLITEVTYVMGDEALTLLEKAAEEYRKVHQLVDVNGDGVINAKDRDTDGDGEITWKDGLSEEEIAKATSHDPGAIRYVEACAPDYTGAVVSAGLFTAFSGFDMASQAASSLTSADTLDFIAKNDDGSLAQLLLSNPNITPDTAIYLLTVYDGGTKNPAFLGAVQNINLLNSTKYNIDEILFNSVLSAKDSQAMNVGFKMLMANIPMDRQTTINNIINVQLANIRDINEGKPGIGISIKDSMDVLAVAAASGKIKNIDLLDGLSYTNDPTLQAGLAYAPNITPFTMCNIAKNGDLSAKRVLFERADCPNSVKNFIISEAVKTKDENVMNQLFAKDNGAGVMEIPSDVKDAIASLPDLDAQKDFVKQINSIIESKESEFLDLEET
jgi:hypothetical protein